MFGKKFLQTSSSVVLSASFVSMAQYSSVFANDNAEIQSKVSLENNAGVLSVGEQNDDVVEKSPLEELNELEKQRKEIILKFKALKKLYDEGMEKLNSEDKELVKEINKIKDENGGIWRLRTWVKIYNGTSWFERFVLLICLFDISVRTVLRVIMACSGRSYSQVKKDTLDFVSRAISKTRECCVNTGKFVGNKLSEGFEGTKKLCSDFKAQLSGGYELLPVEENY